MSILFNAEKLISKADNWAPIQQSMNDAGYSGSEVFTAFFIFIGNFVITNLFIGVICQVRFLALLFSV